MALRSGDGIIDVLVVDHDPKFPSTLFREFTRRIGSSLIVGLAYHKNTNAKTERVNGVLGDTLRAFENGRIDRDAQFGEREGHARMVPPVDGQLATQR
jgi:transposase InsO family protein